MICSDPQKCKSLNFPSKTVEMPNTDALTYLMYKTMRDGLADLKESLDETLSKDFNRISDKGISIVAADFGEIVLNVNDLFLCISSKLPKGEQQSEDC